MFPLADAGTPLMWFGCFQLFFGNYLISLLESAILRRFFRAEQPFKTVLAANFASMFCGYGLIWLFQAVIERSDPDPIRYAPLIVIGAWFASFVVTVLVEAPFFAHVLRSEKPAQSAWRASLMANLASYAIIVPLAFLAGPTSALRLHAGWTRKMADSAGWIYYVDSKNHAVRRMRPSGSPDDLVLSLKQLGTDRFDLVAVEPAEEGAVARLVLHQNSGAEVLIAKLGAASQAGTPWEFYRGYAAFASGPGAGGMSFIPKEGVSTGYWAYEGLSVAHRGYALETPFLQESWSSPTLLPNGLVLVEMNGGIYLVDTSQNKAFRIKAGESPSFLRDP